MAELRHGVLLLAALGFLPRPTRAETPSAHLGGSAGAPVKIISYKEMFLLHHDGTYTRTVTKVIEPLNKTGLQQFGQVRVPVQISMETFKLIKAATISPAGKRYPINPADVHRQSIPTAANAPSFSDAKIYSIEFPHVEVGSKLDITYEVTRTKPYFPDQFAYDDVVPFNQLTGSEQVIIHAPAAVKLLTATQGGYTVTRMTNGKTQTITAKIDHPPYAPSRPDLARIMHEGQRA